MVGLTQRQQMVLDFIRQSIVDRGYPPTLREIGARMGIRSTNGVNDHLRALERKGYLTREDMKSRALRPTSLAGPALTSAENPQTSLALDDDMLEIPIVGRVAAGLPLLAEEHIIDTVGSGVAKTPPPVAVPGTGVQDDVDKTPAPKRTGRRAPAMLS